MGLTQPEFAIWTSWQRHGTTKAMIDASFMQKDPARV